jgi:hypothetical protein
LRLRFMCFAFVRNECNQTTDPPPQLSESAL